MKTVPDSPELEKMQLTDPTEKPYEKALYEIDYRPAEFVRNEHGLILDERTERMQIINDALREVADTIERLCPPSRDREIALGYLQAARMFANASIILHEQ